MIVIDGMYVWNEESRVVLQEEKDVCYVCRPPNLSYSVVLPFAFFCDSETTGVAIGMAGCQSCRGLAIPLPHPFFFKT